MMRSRSASSAFLCLSILFITTVQAQTKSPKATPKSSPKKVTQPAPPELEPKAIEILKTMSERLAGAHTLSFVAVESYESPSRQSHPLVYVNKSEVTLQRPDKLRVITPGDGPASEFYYDGKTITAFAPAENLVAVADAPATIDAMLESIFHSSGTYFPFTDLIVADPYKDAAPGIELAYYVGQSHVVGDTTTDIVSYVGDGVFVEIWIGVDDKLPRLIHAVYLDDPAQLRHNLLLSDWKLDETVTANAFASDKAAEAKPIPFAHPHPETSLSAKPPAKSKSTKAK
jgi:hypothetical protein